MRRVLVLAAGAAVLSLTLSQSGFVHVLAQSRMTLPLVAQNSGHVALGLALRKLGVSGTFMQAPAHPDDETNALLAFFAYGMGLRSIDLQNNRGDGGQNEIGPELFRDMGVLRTSELLSAHRIDGAEQYFTRAIDYGYSFDPEEVIEKWGRKEIVGDYVRLIRTLRPDVIVTMNIQGRGGDRAHEATTILVREAYHAAGDPSMYPEQIREGLRPWQPKKLYFSASLGGPGGPGGRGGRGGPGAPAAEAPQTPPPAAQPATPPVKLAPANTAAYDPLLGRTYAEIGSDARSNHKCQGMGGLPPLPGAGGGRGGRGGGGGGGGYQLMETTLPGQNDKDEASLFDGIDTSLPRWRSTPAPNPPQAWSRPWRPSRKASGRKPPSLPATMPAPRPHRSRPDGGARAARATAFAGLTDSARYEIDFRLQIKERDYRMPCWPRMA